ncbi:hypothetical protein [Blastococcus atacamensis]|uniref:hypothetical protein n=1 Tax=Blastococcus atacamensis TaxID=2070508 RepID=UPI0018E49A2B|nr:hypothetical protein [Blastococcus atacamensis]
MGASDRLAHDTIDDRHRAWLAGLPLTLEPAYTDDSPHPHVMEAGTPHARYAIADDADGTWRHEFRAVDYDWESAAGTAEANGRADVAQALRTGSLA